MPVLDKNRSGATADDDGVAGAPGGGQRCSCLPCCFWTGGSRSRRAASGGAGAKLGRSRRRRRWRRLRLKLPWFPWLRKSRKEEVDGDAGTQKGEKQRRCGRLLLLLTASLQAKKALAAVVSGDGTLLPATASSFGDARKQNKPSPTVDVAAPSSSSEQPQPSTAAASARGSATAPARALPAVTSQPSRNTTDEPAGRVWRAPSRRHRHSLHQPDRAERPAGAGGLWTAATTLGVIVLFGRVTAVVFLCSCLYGARFVRARMAGASAKAPLKGGGSRRFGDPVGVAAEKVPKPCDTEECKKKVLMAGLLERAGRRPASRFGR